jgi:hypothetical protein
MDMTWRKSNYSNVNGGDCVEVGVWRKSSYSTNNGGACVEVGSRPKSADSTGNGGECVAAGAATPATPPGTSAAGGDGPAPWRTSSHSSGNGGNCVETATISATVAVRDTKDSGHGSVLRFTPRAWQTFTTTLK